jgi:Tol biopolymer transport system component
MKKKAFAPLILFIIGLAMTACAQQQQVQPTQVASQTSQAPRVPTSAPTKTTKPSSTPPALVTATVEAECATNPVPPELLVPAPKVNNNDKLIAFSTQYHSDIDWDYADVYVVRFDGTGLKQLTFNAGDDGGPIWSSDGKKIIFHSDRNHPVCSENEIGCRMEHFIINPDGTDSRKLTPDSPYYPARSPDGKYIVYSHDFYDPLRLEHNLGDYLSDILVQNISGSYVKNITGELQPGGFWQIQWSPTGRQFAFIGTTEPIIYVHENSGDGYWPRHAYLVNADGSNMQKLPGGPFAGYEHTEAWSPDGQRLAFLTAKGIAIINADSSGFLEYPIEKSLGERDIFWLEDNQSLVFTDAENDYYKINPDLTGLEKLPLATEVEKLIYRFRLLKTQMMRDDGVEKHLSPDGKWIAYFGCSGQIRVIDTETHQSYLVLDGENEKQGMFKDSTYATSYGFSGDLEWAPDSRQLFFTSETLYWAVNQIGRSLFVINLDGTDLHQIDVGREVWFPKAQP